MLLLLYQYGSPSLNDEDDRQRCHAFPKTYDVSWLETSETSNPYLPSHPSLFRVYLGLSKKVVHYEVLPISSLVGGDGGDSGQSHSVEGRQCLWLQLPFLGSSTYCFLQGPKPGSVSRNRQASRKASQNREASRKASQNREALRKASQNRQVQSSGCDKL